MIELETSAPVRLHVLACEEGPFGRLIVQNSESDAVAQVQARMETGNRCQMRVSGICPPAAADLERQVRQSLPEGATAAQMREACAQPRSVHVALPYLDHKEARAHLFAPRMVQPGPYSIAQLAAAAWQRGFGYTLSPPPSVVSEGSFPADAAFLAAALQPLVPGQDATLQVISRLNTGKRARVEWSVQAPAASIDAWLSLPPERTEFFFDAFTAVSLKIQSAMRAWLPAIWLSAPTAFDNPRAASEAILYSAVPPRQPRSRNAYAYDPLEKNQMRSAVEFGRRQLPVLYPRWAETLSATGHPSAEEFQSSHPGFWRRIVVKAAPRVRSLLAAEGIVLDQLVSLATILRKLKRNQDHPLRLNRAVADCMAPLEARLRRLGPALPAPELARLLFVQATAALAGAPLTINLRIHVEGEELPCALRGAQAA